jgi:hypothetical protein
LGNLKHKIINLKNKVTMEHENLNTAETAQLGIDAVIGSPTQLEPVLAQIEHINDLGKSKWYEVVYYDDGWHSCAGSKSFQDGEQVVYWKYCKDCL